MGGSGPGGEGRWEGTERRKRGKYSQDISYEKMRVIKYLCEFHPKLD